MSPYGPAESPRRSIVLYAVVAVLAVLAAVGVGYALFLLTAGGDDQSAGSTAPTATVSPSGAAEGDGDGADSGAEGDGADGDGDASGDSDVDTLGMNAAMAQQGDCLANDGTPDNPELRIVACDDEDEAAAGQMFRVVEVVSERVEGEGSEANEEAQQICADADDYTHHYYEVAEDASFVLCMTEVDS